MNDNIFIIAEAGVNHNGSIELAKKLIDAAVNAGADAVKFQTFRTENIICKDAPKVEYQKRNTTGQESQFEMVKKLELSVEDHHELIHYCNEKGISFLSTPFDLESIDLLNDLEMEIFKISSGEITNLPYLKHVGGLNKTIILSTGMSNLKEIEDALSILTQANTKKEKIYVLQCNTEYPTPFEDINLNAMLTIRDTFKVKVGFSDHSLGIEVPIAAVAMGAKVIEKHFTLDKEMEGPDHKASLEPKELAMMVQAIRNIEIAFGDGIKKPSKSEMNNIASARKSIVARSKINKGEFFSEDNICVKRPGTGISPMRWEEILGKKAKKDFDEEEMIEI